MYRRKKKRMIIVAFAAVLVLALGSMITGVGSRSYWRVLWERVVGDEEASVINIEDMDSQKSENVDELDTYREINQTFGIAAVRMMIKPSNMYLESYTIDKEQRYAVLFYNYKNEIVKYSIYLNDSDSSFGQKETDEQTDEYKINASGKETDEQTDEYKINASGVTIQVEEYSIEGEDKKRYVAEFQYRDVNYQLKGIMEKDKFNEILENLKFIVKKA